MSKLTLFCCVLFTVLIHGNGYEFDDVAFNQYLASEYDDFSTQSTHLRFRREDAEVDNKLRCGPSHWKKQKLCCAGDVMEDWHAEEKDTKMQCYKEITGKDTPDRPTKKHSLVDPLNCEEINKQKAQMRCVYQCVAQKRNLMDSEGNIMEDKISSYIKGKLAPLKYPEDIQDKIVDTCIKEAKNLTRNTDQSKETCNPVALKLAHCFFKEVQLNCPEDQIKDKEACSKFQERLKKGHGMFHRRDGPPEAARDAEYSSSEEDR